MNIKIKVTPWREDHATTLEDSAVLLVRGIELDGKELLASSVTISLEGRNGAFFDQRTIGDFLCLQVRGMDDEQFEQLGFDERTFGSTAAEVGVIVSNLEIELVS